METAGPRLPGGVGRVRSAAAGADAGHEPLNSRRETRAGAKGRDQALSGNCQETVRKASAAATLPRKRGLRC